MNKLTSPWAIITGAGGGIGQALVNVFVEHGYKVIATDIKSMTHEHESVYPITIDLEQITLSESYANEFSTQVNTLTGGLGISALVNNAAVQLLDAAEHISRRDWQHSLNVNLSAPLFMSQLFLKELESNRGAIVNISSIHAKQTKRNFVTYATTKGALSSLTQNMAVDLGGKVRVNAIEPAAVSTEMLKAGFEGKKQAFELLEAFHPIARIATPEEVAQLAVFLCSENASFIHGASISASGGIHGCLSDPDN